MRDVYIICLRSRPILVVNKLQAAKDYCFNNTTHEWTEESPMQEVRYDLGYNPTITDYKIIRVPMVESE